MIEFCIIIPFFQPYISPLESPCFFLVLQYFILLSNKRGEMLLVVIRQIASPMLILYLQSWIQYFKGIHHLAFICYGPNS